MSKVLVCGDLHCPATRKGYLEFCQDLYEEWDCDKVVFIGDVVDWHAISFWAHEPNCPGPKDEYELAKEEVKKWSDSFPSAVVCIGNHDERPARLAKTVHIPEFMLVPYASLWNTPDWTWDYEFSFDDVVYRHKGPARSGGIHPAWNLKNKIRQSVVIGHHHTIAGVKWDATARNRVFAADVGCGIDEKAWQFVYGKDNPIRPFLSALVVIDGMPYLEALRCGKGEPYHDSKF